jgi:hypothetical protein
MWISQCLRLKANGLGLYYPFENWLDDITLVWDA